MFYKRFGSLSVQKKFTGYFSITGEFIFFWVQEKVKKIIAEILKTKGKLTITMNLPSRNSIKAKNSNRRYPTTNGFQFHRVRPVFGLHPPLLLYYYSVRR